MADVKLSGFRELHDSLGQFKKSTERSILRRTAIKALEPVAERARALAPVDSGHLRDSIVVGTSVTAKVRAEGKKELVQGVRVYVGTSDRNAVPREFGTWARPAQPFMRPAWDSTQSQALKIVETQLAAEIDKAAKRAAKRKK